MKGSEQPFILSAFDGRDMIGRVSIISETESVGLLKKMLLHTWNLIMCWFPVATVVVCKFYHNTAYISIIWCSGESLNQKIVK